MKVTVVPAQVTTVEDRIAGPLGISQLLLLIAPVFVDAVLYVCLPDFFHYAVYKVVIMTTVFAVCGLLAIRIKSKIVLLWLIVLLRYCLRPRYFVYDKHSMIGREQYVHNLEHDDAAEVKKINRVPRRVKKLSIAEIMATQRFINSPEARIRFETKKGGLYVHVTEAKQES